MYERDWPFIITGREPSPEDGSRLSVAELRDAFLNAKLDAPNAGEITSRTFGEYQATTDVIVAVFGKPRAVEGLTPEDFATLRAKLAEKRGPVSLGNAIEARTPTQIPISKFTSGRNIAGIVPS